MKMISSTSDRAVLKEHEENVDHLDGSIEKVSYTVMTEEEELYLISVS